MDERVLDALQALSLGGLSRSMEEQLLRGEFEELGGALDVGAAECAEDGVPLDACCASSMVELGAALREWAGRSGKADDEQSLWALLASPDAAIVSADGAARPPTASRDAARAPAPSRARRAPPSATAPVATRRPTTCTAACAAAPA